jgi:hypothetical protein
MKRCSIFFLSLWMVGTAFARSSDGLQVSLLTVEPRPEYVYTIYGHTALRIYDPDQQLDMVFNWGTFNFNAPHFLYRFIRGETDYFLSYGSYAQFLYGYEGSDATVVEQILDLSPEGKELLLKNLSINMLPENAVYRYNFLFDNCTTRVRDLIEQACPNLNYPEASKTTFRQLIHSCTEAYPWMSFGIDLLIGSGADSLITAREEFFLPLGLKEALEGNVGPKPVVLSSQQVLTGPPASERRSEWWQSPVAAAYGLLAAYLVILAVGILGRRSVNGCFAPLFLAAGAAGGLIAFLAAFSTHPCVSPNWNLLWLNPLQWIAFAGYLARGRAGRLFFWYHAVHFVILCGWLLFGRCLPQTFHPADLPLILCLALASGYWLFINRKTMLGSC